jgi:hypothetical protein
MTASWANARFGRPRRQIALFAGLAAALLVSVALGSVLAASATFTAGSAEQGQGAYVSESGQTYWAWRATQLLTVPTPVPGAVSLLAAHPTVLPAASTDYMIDHGTVGNTSVRWEFREATTAPVSTELELRFTDGLSNTAVKITGYVETRATALFFAVLFYFYWDAGTFAPTSVTVETMQATVLVCASVGVCP